MSDLVDGCNQTPSPIAFDVFFDGDLLAAAKADPERVELKPGESKTVMLTIDPRLLADWNRPGWTIAGGTYRFALGSDAETIQDPVDVHFEEQDWRDEAR